jgi:hypothetical protein
MNLKIVLNYVLADEGALNVVCCCIAVLSTPPLAAQQMPKR